MSTDDNPLLTYTAAGDMIGVSHSTISKWVASGRLRSVQMPDSKRRRVRRKTLLDFVDSLEETESFATFESLESYENE